MRLPSTEHMTHPWVIARIAPDFELLDVWALPAQGRRDEFSDLIDIVTSLDPTGAGWSGATRALFALRLRLGAWCGWDHAASPLPIPGGSETTLRVRVPEGLRDTTTHPRGIGSARFVPIYRTDDEWAAEISNSTVHGVLQLAWVDEGNGVYRGRLGVYVKPRGRLGVTYLAFIRPFRHLVVYPELIRQVERDWSRRPRLRDQPARARRTRQTRPARATQ